MNWKGTNPQTFEKKVSITNILKILKSCKLDFYTNKHSYFNNNTLHDEFKTFLKEYFTDRNDK